MKKFISSLLIFCIFFTTAAIYPGAAAEVSSQPMLRLNHADIEQLVMRNNTVIRNNRITEQGLNDVVGTPMMVDAMLEGQRQLIAMQAQASAILAQIMASPSDQPDAVREGIILSLTSDIASAEREIRQISAQIEQMGSDPVRNNVSRALMQINNANRQIIWGVESLYLGYHTLSRQLEQTQLNLEALNRSIASMERRHAVGHVTARALQNLKSNVSQMVAGITSMESELENISGQLNIMLGRAADAPLQIGTLPAAERNFLDTRDIERDLVSARRNSAAINIALSEIDEVSRQYGAAARRQEAIAQNNHDNELRAMVLRHESLIRAINDRQASLELAEEQLELLLENLRETERRHSRGLVSGFDLEQARTEIKLQEIRIASADAELFSAIRRYEWFVRGLST